MPPVSQQLELSNRDAGTADILLEDARRRRTATFRRVWRVAGPLLVLILLCLAWDIYVRAKGSFYLADSLSILRATLAELGEGKVWSALLTSDLSLVMGFIAAVILGVPLGLLIGRFRAIDKALAPYLQMALVTPMAVLMPIVLIALGLSRTAQVVVVFLFALPFIVVPTRGGVSTIPTEWTDMASAYGARELQAWRLVLIPGAIRAIVNGLRLGFAHALTGEITIELSLIAIGIGQLMIEYQSRYQAAELFAFVVIVSLQSLVVLNLLFLLEKRVTR